MTGNEKRRSKDTLSVGPLATCASSQASSDSRCLACALSPGDYGLTTIMRCYHRQGKILFLQGFSTDPLQVWRCMLFSVNFKIAAFRVPDLMTFGNRWSNGEAHPLHWRPSMRVEALVSFGSELWAGSHWRYSLGELWFPSHAETTIQLSPSRSRSKVHGSAPIPVWRPGHSRPSD